MSFITRSFQIHIPFGIVAALFLCQACTALYGIRSPKSLTAAMVVESARQFSIPESDLFLLDTGYGHFLKSQDTSFRNQIQNHFQHLQALYFNQAGTLVSFQVNCYAGGFPNLNWRRNGIFEVFPPKNQAPIDGLLPLPTLLRLIRPVPGSQAIDPTKTDHLVFIFWNRFMGRQSRRLLETVKENSQLAIGQKVRLVFVNNDNLFADHP